MASRECPEAAATAHLRWALFAVGLAVGGLMVARSQVGGDQLNLLARGWLLAERGIWIPYGNPMSTGGDAPGSLTSLIVGLPLLLWRDYRAPSVLVLLFHVAAYLLLDRVVGQALAPRARLFLALLYWLNPWQLYFAGFLWNPNYLYLFGAVHLWTCWRQRRNPSFWLSLLHVLALGLAFQIHGSVLLLVVASAILWWRGLFRVSWAGVVAGALLSALALVPWLLAAARDPSILAAGKGFLGRGLVFVFPLLRGLLYWLRYSSFSFAAKMLPLDFSTSLGPRADAVLVPPFFLLTEVVGPLSVLLPLAAHGRLLRHGRVRRLLERGPAPAGGRAWMRGYALSTLAAAFVVFCLAPTTIMMWQGLIILHAAVLPLVLWLGALERTRWATAVRRGARAWIAAEVLLLLAMALGGPFYRCHGRKGMAIPLRHDSPMLHQLGILDACPVAVDQPDGWWPDVLPPE